jgi:hypothetical protein
MSFNEILEELANLTHQQRRELGFRLLSFETDDDLALCDHVAAEGFEMLDQLELEDQLRGTPEPKRSLDR